MISHAKPHAPLDVYAAKVASEWVDYNGHMNDAAFAVVFSRSVDALMDRIGLDAAARKRTGEKPVHTADDAPLFQGGEGGRRARRFLSSPRAR